MSSRAPGSACGVVSAERAKAEGTPVPSPVQACASDTALAPVVSQHNRRLLMRGASALEVLGHQARADWLDIMAEQIFFALRDEIPMTWRLIDAGRILSAARRLQRHAPHYDELAQELVALASNVATVAIGCPVDIRTFGAGL